MGGLVVGSATAWVGASLVGDADDGVGSTALDFGNGTLANTTRRYTTSATAALPSTGWAVGCWIRHSAGLSGNQVFVGFGTSGGASSFQLRSFAGSQYGAQARDGSGSNVSDGINYPSAGDYLLVSQYMPPSDGMRDFLIPKGATVTAADSSSSATFATITPGSGWYIGSDGTDWTKLPLGEAFVVGRRLTDAELTTLAAGAPITDVEASPLLYWQFRGGAVDSEPNLGTESGASATRVGTGYAEVTEFWPLSGDQTINVNQASEGDSAQAITARLQLAVAQAAETNTAQAVAAQQRGSVAQASEGNTAQVIVARQASALAQASEGDAAQPIAPGQPRAVAQASEGDAAQAVSAQAPGAIGQVPESDAAQALTARQRGTVGQAAESNIAQGIAVRQARTVAQAGESNAAQGIASRQARTLGQAPESDAAQGIASRQRITLGQAAESEAGQPVAPQAPGVIGQALEADSAQAIAATLARQIAQASETNTANQVATQLRSAVAQAAEGDAASQVLPSQSSAIGPATESDTALAAVRRMLSAIGLAIEANEATGLVFDIDFGDYYRYDVPGMSVRYDVLGVSMRYDVPPEALRYDVPSIGATITA